MTPGQRERGNRYADVHHERDCRGQSSGLDPRCRLDDDAAGQKDEACNCKGWSSIGASGRRLLDKIRFRQVAAEYRSHLFFGFRSELRSAA